MYIYGLIDPRDNELRYIGKADNAYKRLFWHMAKCHQAGSKKNLWLRDLKASGAQPRVVVLCETDKEHWREDERFAIAGFREDGYRLLNGSIGGEGGWVTGVPRGRIILPPRPQKPPKAPKIRATHCANGHEYTTKNTRWSRGYRYCRECNKEAKNRSYRAMGRVSRSEQNMHKQHCKRGHIMEGDNLRVVNRADKKGVMREFHFCRECTRITNQAYEDRKLRNKKRSDP